MGGNPWLWSVSYISFVQFDVFQVCFRNTGLVASALSASAPPKKDAAEATKSSTAAKEQPADKPEDTAVQSGASTPGASALDIEKPAKTAKLKTGATASKAAGKGKKQKIKHAPTRTSSKFRSSAKLE